VKRDAKNLRVRTAMRLILPEIHVTPEVNADPGNHACAYKRLFARETGRGNACECT